MTSYRSLLFKIKLQNKFHRKFCTVPIEEKQIKIAKWNVNYIKVGTGPHHVFCLPGALGTIWTDFKPQVDGFDRKLFTLIVWDPPGYGKSRPPDKEFTTDFHARDAEYALEFMKALEIPKYSLIGWSDGGVAALIHAAKYPGFVDKLVVTAAGSKLAEQSISNYAKLKDINTWSEKLRKPLEDIYGDKLQHYWTQWIECIDAIASQGGNVCADILKDIKCPTLVFHGGKDPVSPLESSEFIVQNIAGSRLHVYPEGKHNVHLRYWENFNKRVQDFLLN